MSGTGRQFIVSEKRLQETLVHWVRRCYRYSVGSFRINDSLRILVGTNNDNAFE